MNRNITDKKQWNTSFPVGLRNLAEAFVKKYPEYKSATNLIFLLSIQSMRRFDNKLVDMEFIPDEETVPSKSNLERLLPDMNWQRLAFWVDDLFKKLSGDMVW